jgi:hypothetical protein
MNNSYTHISFELMGLNLQEPMSLLTNWLIAFFSLYAFNSLRKYDDSFRQNWRTFYLFLFLSTFIGGLGHLFYQYSGIYGKMPSWFLGTLAGYFVINTMIEVQGFETNSRGLKTLNLIFTIAIISLALWFKNFSFIAFDAIFKYILCGIMAFRMIRLGADNFNKIVIGVLFLTPASFIYLLDINTHRWLNRDDLSHCMMFICVIFFYLGVIKHQTVEPIKA